MSRQSIEILNESRSVDIDAELDGIIHIREKGHLSANAKVRTIALRNDRNLEIDRSGVADMLHITNNNGATELTVRITRDGPVITVQGASLSLRASETVFIDSKRIHLRASEKIDIETEGDVAETVGGNRSSNISGDITSEARAQSIRARLGNVNIRANDDVAVDGERIRMNC